MKGPPSISSALAERFGEAVLAFQETADNIPTAWVSPGGVREVLGFLKRDVEAPYPMLFDLTAVDERLRTRRDGQPASDFTVVYHLLSLDRNEDVRVKVPLSGDTPSLSTITDLWPSANWYEREAWDLFGVTFAGHPHLARILLPPTWTGHPLRKDHPARATDMEPFSLPPERQEREQEALRFSPEAWGMKRSGPDFDYLFLNLGPHHPGVHGVVRFLLQLDGEQIVDVVPEIGFHHRGAEKMAERQTWHTFIPYTDRVDYLSGVMNNLPYVLACEKLAGIEAPDRARVMRVMLAELFRVASHLVSLGILAADVGMFSPVFYTFTDRERVFDIVTAVTGARMHPSFFRLGGVAMDLPRGWDALVRDFLAYLRPRLAEYETLILKNRLFKARTRGVGACSAELACEWGMTGPNLRACGVEWDLRKKRPYSGYDQFEFDIPTGQDGDAYTRGRMRFEEIHQSLKIIAQCVENMPQGPVKADHPLSVPPPRDRMLHDIETLIQHFLAVSWGPILPPGEASVAIEATKGWNAYYLISDGGNHSYRTRIRTPSFPHLQMLRAFCRGLLVPDLIAVLGSLDYVMADVDR